MNESALISGLTHLLSGAALDEQERVIASRCLRRIEQPLRITIFGTEPDHAGLLLNLLAGRSLLPPIRGKIQAQVQHSEMTIAEVVQRNGETKSFNNPNFEDIFDVRPQKVRIGADLPVLKKVTFQVFANLDQTELGLDADKVLLPSDAVLWTGAALTLPLTNIWSAMPDSIRDHSHLVLSPLADEDSWAPTHDEFVSVTRVDPAAAQAAKTRQSGVDKAGFEAAGGKAIVREIKKEIEALQKSATDAAEVLLIRHGMDDGLVRPAGRTKSAVRQTPAPEPEAVSTEAEDVWNLDETAPMPVSPPTADPDPEPRRMPAPVVQAEAEIEHSHQHKVSIKRVSRAIKSRDLSSEVVADALAKIKNGGDAESETDPKATPWSLGL